MAESRAGTEFFNVFLAQEDSEAVVTDEFFNVFLAEADPPAVTTNAIVTDEFFNVFIVDQPVLEAPRQVTGKRLGCGIYRAFLATRGGDELLAELAFAPGSRFSRQLDAVSSATFILDAEQDASCVPHLDSVQPWEAELIVYRDAVIAWAGPIPELTWRIDGSPPVNRWTLTARDLFEWFAHRLIHSDHVFVDEDLSSIAATLAEDALSVDESPNITFLPSITGVRGSRTYASGTYPLASDAILELARTGFDFTAIGRTIRTGGMEVPTEPLVTLTSDTFEVTEMVMRGLDQASRVVMIGAQGQLDAPLSAEADLGGIPASGVLEEVVTEPVIEDATSLAQAAQTRLDLLRDAPFTITGRLSPDAAVRFEDLIPGARVDVRLRIGFRTVQEQTRLARVDVTPGAGETVEEVSVTLETLGTTA